MLLSASLAMLTLRGEEWLLQTGGELKRATRAHQVLSVILPVAEHFHTFLSLFFF